MSEAAIKKQLARRVEVIRIIDFIPEIKGNRQNNADKY